MTNMEHDDDRPRSKGPLERYERRMRKYRDIFEGKADADAADDDAELDEVITKALRDHHRGHHSLSSALVQHLHDRLERRRERHGYTKRKESTMDRTTELRDIAKAGNIVAVAKAIADENRSYGISESEFTGLVTEHAKARYPELRPDAAFAKVWADSGAEGLALRKASVVLKETPWVEPIRVDYTPRMVGGASARDLSDQSEALRNLAELGQQRWPGLSKEQQFARAFESRPDLAVKAHRRPSVG
jgi:hypothetical protein